MFEPEIVKAPAPPLFNVGKENPPPAKVFEVPEVMEIVPAPDVLKFDPLTVQLAPATVQVLEPKEIDLIELPADENEPIDTATLFESMPPAVNVNNLVDPRVNAS